MQMPVPGDFFQGKYKIGDVLGIGGFAHVFRALDVEVGRDVAIKVLAPEGTGYTDQVESRFLREARVIASLQDPHTITMFEFGQTESGLLFMVFEYVSGMDLAEVLRQHGSLPSSVVQHILRQLLSALNEAHQNGVLHLDIKPANIIVFEYMDDPWRVKLIDFGIAKPIPTPGRDLTQLTRDGVVIGTPRYMAPEQFYGDALTACADIYSLGLVAHEMLVGRPAIAGTTSQELMRSAISGEPIRLPPMPDAVGLARVIDRMTERDAASRFGSAMAVVAALDTADRISAENLAPRPRQLEPPQDTSSVRRAGPQPTPARRRLSSWIPVVAGGLALAVVAGLGILMSTRAAEPRPRAAVKAAIPNGLVKVAPQMRETAVPEEPSGTDAGSDASVAAEPSGCGQNVDWRGTRTRTLRLGFETREYSLHVPENYDPDRAHPIVLLFHNAMMDGKDVIRITEFGDIADQNGLVLVAPVSLDPTRPWYGSNDMEFTLRALAEARATVCTDPAHLYALGHGGGGNFAVRVRCQVPLSAFATSGSGEYETDTICGAEPTPFLRFYGALDRHVPEGGGQGCFDKSNFRSAQRIEEQWRVRNGASGEAKKWISQKGGSCALWSGAAEFASCRLNGGHDWPKGAPKFELPGCGAPPPDFPMAATAWRFFSTYGRSLDAVPADAAAGQ